MRLGAVQFTAHKAEQILVGKQAPGSIPVEALQRFSDQIRMPAARRLNLPPPLPMQSHAELITTEPVPQSRARFRVRGGVLGIPREGPWRRTLKCLGGRE